MVDRLHFDNRFVSELPGDPDSSPVPRLVEGALWSPVRPTPVQAPQLLAHASEMAELLELSPADVHSERFAQVFSGNELLPGMFPFAAGYGGHQFGSWAGQLGDGRAISLGEVVTGQGARWELQLKGAGRTAYSRRGDGRAVLRSSIREFLCSEAMAHLGIPTTRALSLVGTGEPVIRDMFYSGDPRPEPGAIVCRVAPSFLRFGNFELLASRDEAELLSRLIEFTLDRDFPHLGVDLLERRRAWFREVCTRTAKLVVEWMRVGFVHGVMNTDNMSILGLTLDYGPYGWLEDFDPDWTPNTSDAQTRRYRYANQPAVAQWNLNRLAYALHLVWPDVDALEAGLKAFAEEYAEGYSRMLFGKFGLGPLGPDAAHPGEDPAESGGVDPLALEGLALEGLALLRELQLDHTLFFRRLAEWPLRVDAPTSTHPMPADTGAKVSTFDLGQIRAHFEPAFYSAAQADLHLRAFAHWLRRWEARGPEGVSREERCARMHRINPQFVLRNYLVQEAIQEAEKGDSSGILELLDASRHPYDPRPAQDRLIQRRPEWARDLPGASRLSCSS
jgi:serine/tyrosine/threonine adenylyltransferase